MQKLRTIIADDVSGYNNLLKSQLKLHCPTVEVVGAETTLEGTYNLIVDLKPDLVILDVHFGGPTSFDLLKRLKDENLITFQLIFLSGFTETSHFINAFKYSAIQYILKPVDDLLLIEAIDKAIEIVKSKAESQMQDQVEVMIKNIQLEKGEMPNLILLRQIKKIFERVDINDILYFESDSTMTNVQLNSGRVIKTVDLIGSYEYLTTDNSFFRISQSIIVNMNHVFRYEALDKLITFANGTKLLASRQRDKELRRWFGIK